MPNRNLLFLKDTIVHVYNRGNSGNLIFRHSSDYKWFIHKIHLLGFLEISIIPAYCLMPTHFHLCLKFKANADLSRLIQRLELSYAKYFNRKYSVHGHVFEGPFKAKAIAKDSYAICLCKYIHLNPVKDKLVEKPEDWEYSNYNNVVNHFHDDDIRAFYGTFFNDEKEYQVFVNDGDESYLKKGNEFGLYN